MEHTPRVNTEVTETETVICPGGILLINNSYPQALHGVLGKSVPLMPQSSTPVGHEASDDG